ncbi:MAG TPA: CrcB family protein, partial [Rhodopila sp.]|uniref:CrcB family protein n=1 Tax=Rhodopila sp. TaxID=2480087 RepID=UPI002B67C8A0
AGQNRLAVPADVRALVMVGICGGFTTFSSFSLQTLDLARDGRFAQAMGNVALSIVLCLAAVTAGHYGAESLKGARSGIDRAERPVPAHTAVAVLNRPERADALLDAASGLLRTLGGGRITALAVRMPPVDTILPSEEVMTAERETSVRAEQEGWAQALRKRVTAWASIPGMPVDFIDVEGDAAQIAADQGRHADAIVIERPEDHEPERMRDCLHAALFETDRPVLVIPPGHPRPFGDVVAIAWKDDERAAKALRSSLDLLRKARAVHVLCAGDTASVPPTLTEHGIATTLHQLAVDEPVGDVLLAGAHQAGADLLVMGAFAHGEWRERIFGGATRTMLAKADLPLWMRH